MEIRQAAYDVLEQLQSVLKQIKQEDYVKVIPTHNATVGQHARHMIEFFVCLFEGISTGLVNYDKRKRDQSIESNPGTAITRTNEIMDLISRIKNDPSMILEINYDMQDEPGSTVKTSYTRELVYNIEHTIHHMAIIKTILSEFFGYITLPENFGIAVSTVRFRNSAIN